MALLPIFLKAISVLIMGLGTSNVVLGGSMLEGLAKTPFPIKTAIGRVADNQLRFFGGVEAGWGAMLWWASNDLSTRQVPLAILAGTMVYGAVGRAIAAARHGFPSAQIPVFMALEAGVPLAVWLFGNFN